MDNKRSIEYQRRCAVNKAWMNERQQVMQSRGSRNWTQDEQREILATGKCHGYEGQHMLSVKDHPEHAGNDKNIQFLTHEEHFRAHGGNWKNDTNGRYDLRTGKIESFANNSPDVQYKELSDPLSERSKKIAVNRYQKLNKGNNESVKAKSLEFDVRDKLPVKKNSISNSSIMSDKRAMFNKRATHTDASNQFTSFPGNSLNSTSMTKNNNGDKKSNSQGMHIR